MRFSAMDYLAGVVWDDLGSRLGDNDKFVWFVPAPVARDQPVGFSPGCDRLLIRSSRDALRKLVLVGGIFSVSRLPVHLRCENRPPNPTSCDCYCKRPCHSQCIPGSPYDSFLLS